MVTVLVLVHSGGLGVVDPGQLGSSIVSEHEGRAVPQSSESP
jgi:hypothetical protein